MKLRDYVSLTEEQFYSLFVMGFIKSDTTVDHYEIIKCATRHAESFWDNLIEASDDMDELIEALMEMAFNQFSGQTQEFLDNYSALTIKYKMKMPLHLDLWECVFVHEDIMDEYFQHYMFGLLLNLFRTLHELCMDEDIMALIRGQDDGE